MPPFSDVQSFLHKICKCIITFERYTFYTQDRNIHTAEFEGNVHSSPIIQKLCIKVCASYTKMFLVKEESNITFGTRFSEDKIKKTFGMQANEKTSLPLTRNKTKLL